MTRPRLPRVPHHLSALVPNRDPFSIWNLHEAAHDVPESRDGGGVRQRGS
jgi:hypothetical protein